MNPTVFQACVVLGGSLATVLLGLVYFRHVRLPRPAIGAFNAHDIAILFVFIVTLPALYVVLPPLLLTGFLVTTFVSALSIGYKPLLPGPMVWLGIAALIGVNIWVARGDLGTMTGWQLYWGLTSVAVLLAAAAIANLYVQGGMRLQHVAWFALGLAVYDPVFSLVIPLTVRLADTFAGFPLDPSIGFRAGVNNANIGIGDLLVYTLFTVAAYKAYGRRAATYSLGAVLTFGGLVPVLVPLVMSSFTRGNIGFVVPAQTFFGPAAFALYLWLRRQGPERSMAAWLTAGDGTQPYAALALAPAPIAETLRPAGWTQHRETGSSTNSRALPSSSPR
jgi:hypothetical protein